MSSELDETAGGTAPPSEAPGEAPATDAPGDKIYVCPACGTRYDDPTECANGHAPTATVEYDRATFEAAAAGDADALASVNETAAAAAGNTAGVVPTEATPTPVAVEPMPAPGAAGTTAAVVDPSATATEPGVDSPAVAGVDPAAPAPAPAATAATPAGIVPELGGVAHALAQLEAAIASARNSLGITG